MGFGDDIAKGAERVLTYAKDWERGVVISLFSAVINDSPVDSGRFRANWFFTTGQPSNKTTASTGYANKANEIAFQVSNEKTATNYILTNNMPYAQKLEYGGYGNGPKTTGGYSNQAVGGMVRKNAARIKAISRKNK